MSSIKINKILRKIAKRAEKLEGQYIIESFVDTGTLFDSVTVKENAVVFGRRGTGKTHLLRYVSEQMKNNGDISVYIDLRNIGSNGGLYSEVDTPASQKAMTLIVDTLQAIHEHIKDEAFKLPETSDIKSEELLEGLDDFIDSASNTKISGEKKTTTENTSELTSSYGLSLELKAQLDSLIASGAIKEDLARALKSKEIIETTGSEEFHIIYPDIARATKKINAALGDKKLWLLIDEWAEIPLDLQPYLADMLKRTFFSHHNIIVKIGAIENRSKFQKVLSSGYNLGIELGADASSHISLDEFMVFDNDAKKAQSFLLILFISMPWRLMMNLRYLQMCENSPLKLLLKIMRLVSLQCLVKELQEMH
ncbi:MULTISPECIES: ORC-CDC6 family AAA ATPase [unclassified Serratia (in: enterobacteria)]|uniref:ORC-CDC6 family AAA ATPase n=1 Tax=unclassified Serratia (in: enterobacteria) TaxID=2647522 RepID=UPI003076578C